MTPKQLAQLFHETYERLAPDFGYTTREASAVPWTSVPEQNKRLMIAVATEILAQGTFLPPLEENQYYMCVTNVGRVNPRLVLDDITYEPEGD